LRIKGLFCDLSYHATLCKPGTPHACGSGPMISSRFHLFSTMISFTRGYSIRVEPRCTLDRARWPSCLETRVLSNVRCQTPATNYTVCRSLLCCLEAAMYKDHSHDAPHNSVSTSKGLTGTFTFTFTLSVDDRLLCFATQNFHPEERAS